MKMHWTEQWESSFTKDAMKGYTHFQKHKEKYNQGVIETIFENEKFLLKLELIVGSLQN